MSRARRCGLALATWACACAPRGSNGIDTFDQNGVWVIYNLGCERGCDQIARGDLVIAIDGRPITTTAGFDAAALTDGRAHAVRLRARRDGELHTVRVIARPRDDRPPLVHAPPLWTVSAAALDRAPAWARRAMFGHASPMVRLVGIDGGIVDGRTLVGRKHLMVYWDGADRVAEATAVAFMQVLQKAQADLAARGVDILFTHAAFRGGRKQPMNDTDLRAWAQRWSLRVDGTPLPAIPMYRRPDATEFDAARELGVENAYTVIENLGRSPAIVILDERGIVRWHSEGVQLPEASSALTHADQFTIIEAVRFALDAL
ncbi:MAG: hypothetical protein K1X88_30990 [Nannocystaceae bacterium]|nr:hypothetical protein [Nannocystaceae bacterium]